MKLKNWFRVCAAALALGMVSGAAVHGQIITNVVETGGDNTGSSITAKWTGQTFQIVTADNPFPGAVVGNNYTVGTFGHLAPFVLDRNHAYSNNVSFTNMLPIPSYLVGGEYIMSAQNNRDNAGLQLDVTLSKTANVYLLIDNRLGDAFSLDPPVIDATHMQWVTTQGWTPVATGQNLFGNGDPDQVYVDLNTNGGIEDVLSVYTKQFPAGTFSLFQADAAGIDMYGVVVKAVPEPATATSLLAAVPLAAAALRRRRR